MHFAELRERVVAANLALVEAGLVILTFGNASVVDRATGVLAIKPSGVAYDALRPEDVPVLDLTTGAVVAGDRRPSSDAPTHLLLVRAFAAVGAVVHTHSPFATAWAQARRDLPCLGTTHADHFRGSVPVTRALTEAEIGDDYEEQTGAVIVETFAKRDLDPMAIPAALVASHGPFVWAVSIEAAVENAIVLEDVAASSYRSIGLAGNIESIAEPLLAKHFERKHGAAAYYGQPA